MMDDCVGVKVHEHRASLKGSGQPMDMDECDQWAEEQLEERVNLITKEILAVDGGGLDACLGVSQDNRNSIKHLTETTLHCVSSERVRILYITARVTRIDLKIDLAVGEVIRTYKHSVRAAAPTNTRMGAAVDVCSDIIACFGLPTVTTDMALEILKSNVVDDLGNSLLAALAEGLAALGMLGTLVTYGMLVFLAAGAANIPLAVPATARLLLTLAADMILILARPFRDASIRNIAQPLTKDLGAAARASRPIAPDVHKKVKKLVLRKNAVACFRTDKIRVGFAKIIEEYRSRVMEGISMPPAERFGESDDEMSDSSSDADLIDDMKDAGKELES